MTHTAITILSPFSSFDSLNINKNKSNSTNTYNSKSVLISPLILQCIVNNSMLKCVQNPQENSKKKFKNFSA